MKNINDALRVALLDAKTGQGSYGPNYDGARLAASVAKIIAEQVAQEDEKDAARYRLLRDGGNHNLRLVRHAPSGVQVLEMCVGDALDRHVDRAQVEHDSNWMTLAIAANTPKGK